MGRHQGEGWAERPQGLLFCNSLFTQQSLSQAGGGGQGSREDKLE